MTNTINIRFHLLLAGLCALAFSMALPSAVGAACTPREGGFEENNVKQLKTGSPDPVEGDCAEETNFEFNSKTTDVGIRDMVLTFLRFGSALVGIAVVAGVITGGIVYSTSQGSPAGIQKGRKIIGSSILALILFALMFAIINFLLPGGVLV